MATQDDTPRRKARPVAARTGPKRKLDALAPPAPPAAPSPAAAAPADSRAEIGRLVSDAVREGYDVINENLRQGRAAADAYSANQYRLEDATQDLSKLGKRMVGLSRELSTTMFDLLAVAVRDPTLQAALQGQGHRGKAAGAPAVNVPPAAPPPSGPVSIAVEIRGSFNATGTATDMQPRGGEAPFPKVNPLAPIDPADERPAITKTGLGATLAGGLQVIVEVAPDQPPGHYRGTIVDRKSGATLSIVTVTVAAEDRA